MQLINYKNMIFCLQICCKTAEKYLSSRHIMSYKNTVELRCIIIKWRFSTHSLVSLPFHIWENFVAIVRWLRWFNIICTKWYIPWYHIAQHLCYLAASSVTLLHGPYRRLYQMLFTRQYIITMKLPIWIRSFRFVPMQNLSHDIWWPRYSVDRVNHVTYDDHTIQSIV